MRTVILERPGRLVAADTPPPSSLQAGGALVRVRRVGVCGTDFHAWGGRQPFFTFPRILGHELAAEVVDIAGAPDPAARIAPGDRCAIEPYLNCGRCRACLAGRGNCCERLQVLGVHVDGGMRELIEVPIEKLHPSRTLDLDVLALVETVSVGAHAVRRAGLGPGDPVLVVGAGPIGLAAATSARSAGADVALMDASAARVDFCRRALSFDRAVVPDDDRVESARRFFDGDLPLVVIDATGNPGSMQTSFTLAAHAGRLVLVGLAQADLTFNDPDFHRRELTVFASRNALPDDFAAVIAAMEEGRLDVRPWITHRAMLEQVPSVFPSWTKPETAVIKALVEV